MSPIVVQKKGKALQAPASSALSSDKSNARGATLVAIVNVHPTESNVMKAQSLWDALEVIHSTINSMARENPRRSISEAQCKTLQGIFQQVQALLDEHSIMVSCARVERTGISAGDALLTIGQYRAALRTYRVDVLGENPFKLHTRRTESDSSMSMEQ